LLLEALASITHCLPETSSTADEIPEMVLPAKSLTPSSLISPASISKSALRLVTPHHSTPFMLPPHGTKALILQK
jgi:hypothetical protein